MFTKIDASNITSTGVTAGTYSNSTITVNESGQITSASSGVSGGPKITNLQVTDSSWTVLDDTAVDLTGGYFVLTGTGFAAGCLVYIGTTPASSVAFVATTSVRVTVPGLAAGTYPVYLVNSDGGVAINVPGVTYSASPSWQTSSSLADQYDGVLLSLSLVATDATAYTVTSGSLPPGLSLNANTGVISGTVTGVTVDTTYTFTVRATDAEQQDSPRTFTVTITVSDPYFKLTTLLLTGNSGNTVVTDSSTNNFAITVAGDSRASNFSPYLTGWSCYFDGTGDYLTVPDDLALDLDTGNFTIEAWIYPTSVSPAFNYTILAKGSSSATGTWQFDITSSSKLRFQYDSAGAITSTASLVANTWTHVAVVREGTGSNQTKLYINGGNDGTGSVSSNFGDATTVKIGFNRDGTTNYVGYISNARVVKGTALYTANFTPATTTLTAVANTSLLTCHTNRLVDSSTNNFAITKNGDVQVVSFNPFNLTNTGTTGSMYFDGTGDYVVSASSSNLSPGTGDFTLECWVYFTATGSDPGILQIGPSAPAATTPGYTNSIGIARGSGNGKGFFINNGTYTTGTSSVIPLYTWCHLAVARQGTTHRYFVNGVLDGTVTDSANYTGTYLFAGVAYGTNYPMTGYISDIRFIKGTAVYTSNFTPPTAPLTAVTNTSLLTLQNRQPHYNHSFQDSSSNNFLITRNGNATQGTFSPFSQTGWSNYFDGSGDYLSIANNTAFDLSSSDFTVEAWVYRTGDSGAYTEWILGKRSTSSGDGYLWSWNLGIGSSNFATFGNYNGAVTSTTAINLNTWYHIAVTRISGAYKLYVNGLLESTNAGFAIPEVNVSLTIGNYPVDNPTFTGYISNIRIIKGNGLYTANFTPATTTLTAVANTSLLTCHANRFLDSSTNNFAITRNGDTRVTAWSPFAPTQVYTPSIHGGSAYVNATSTYLALPASTPLVNIADWTVDFWMYPTSYVNAQGIFGASNGGGASLKISFQINGSNITLFKTGTGIISITQPALNTWTHISVVRSSSTGLAYIFVNGALGTSGSFGSEAVTSNFQLFTNGEGATSGMYGYLSSFRVSNVARQITAFTVPSQPYQSDNSTILLTNFADAAIVDRTGRNVLETVADAKTSSVQVKYGTGAMSFDGTGDVIAIPDSRLLDFGSSDWTIEFWIYRTVNATHVILTKRTSNAPAGMPVIYANTSNKIIVEFSSQTTFTPTNTISLNTWTHVAIVRSGSGSNNVKQYLNGTVDPTTVSWTTLSTNTSPLYIGGDSNGNNFTGYIDDIRITQFARYTANFTPPTVPPRLK